MKKSFCYLFIVLLGFNNLKAQNNQTIYSSVQQIDTNIMINAVAVKGIFNNIVLGSTDGLYLCNYNDTLHFNSSNCGLTNNTITDVKYGSNFVTAQPEIITCNAQGYSKFQVVNGGINLMSNLNSTNSNLLSDTVLKIYPFSPYQTTDDFWLSVKNNGVAHVQNNSTITNYTTSNSALPSNQVNKIVHGYNVNQATTFCTDKGFALLENGQITVYDTTNTILPSNKISSFVYVNNLNGIKWIISTVDKGIVVVDTSNTWHTLNTSNSNLPSDSVLFIYRETLNNFLLSTNLGLFDVDFSINNLMINQIVDTNDTYYDCSEVVDPLYCGFCNFLIAHSKHKLIEFTICTTDIKESMNTQNSDVYFSNSTLNIQTQQKTECAIVIYDLLGNIVWTKTNQNISGNTQYEINNLQSGIYVVNVKTKEGQLSKKVVLNGN